MIVNNFFLPFFHALLRHYQHIFFGYSERKSYICGNKSSDRKNMDHFLLIIIGCALASALLAFLVTWLVQRGRMSALRADMNSRLQAQENEAQRAIQQREGELQADLRDVQAELRVVREQSDRRAERLQTLLDEKTALTGTAEASAKELELLKEQMAQQAAQRQQELDELQKRFTQQLQLAQEQLKVATEQVLRQRSEELTGKNSEQLGGILTPLKEQIKKMEDAMQQNRESQLNTSARLSQSIEDMMRQTKDIASEANNLASALRGKNKMQGNWGELVLSELLESQGLTEGVQFTVQGALRDVQGNAIKSDEGQSLIPDVVLHLADGKDVVIDSKVSLSAFVDYWNAEDDAVRQAALQGHLQSIRKHYTELAKKDYKSYIKPPRRSLGYVIMFVPNEGALQLALATEPTLWREAFEKGVFIAGEQNLLAALRIIEMAWVQVTQAENQEKIYALASTLVDRVGDFVKRFEDVRIKLDAAQEAYKEAYNKLYSGRQSLLVPANSLVKLGAKANPAKPIPDVTAKPLPELPDATADEE